MRMHMIVRILKAELVGPQSSMTDGALLDLSHAVTLLFVHNILDGPPVVHHGLVQTVDDCTGEVCVSRDSLRCSRPLRRQ